MAGGVVAEGEQMTEASTNSDCGRDCGLIYFNVGTKCLARLVVSAYNARKHWAGPICILNGGLDGGIVETICRDERIGAEYRTAAIVQRRKNTAYAAKPTVMRQSPFEVTVFVDADTLPVGGLDGLPLAVLPPFLTECPGIALTAFSHWETTGKIMRRRIESIARTSEESGRLAEISLSRPMPAINTGVVVYRRDDPFLRHWEVLTETAWNIFIADEIAAQVLTADPEKYPHTLLDDRWNASPMYHSCKAGQVCIWHFHGQKHVEHPGGKGAAGHRLWWPAFMECWAENVGGIREWIGDGLGDKGLRGHIERARIG